MGCCEGGKGWLMGTQLGIPVCGIRCPVDYRAVQLISELSVCYCLSKSAHSLSFFMKFFRKPWTEKKKWFNGLLSRGTDPQDSTTSLRMQMGNTCALMASILFFIISLF